MLKRYKSLKIKIKETFAVLHLKIIIKNFVGNSFFYNKDLIMKFVRLSVFNIISFKLFCIRILKLSMVERYESLKTKVKEAVAILHAYSAKKNIKKIL